jgi:hypothetical protein
MNHFASRRKYHYIYKIIRFDGRYYIGMHSADDLEDGYFGSGVRIQRSILRHGRDKHVKEILEFLPSRKELNEREAQLVTEELLGDPMCMNLVVGGGASMGHTAETLEKLSKVNLGRKHTAKARTNMGPISFR